MLRICSFGSFALDTLTSLESSPLLEARAYRVHQFWEAKGSVEAKPAIQSSGWVSRTRSEWQVSGLQTQHGNSMPYVSYGPFASSNRKAGSNTGNSPCRVNLSVSQLSLIHRASFIKQCIVSWSNDQ